MSLVRNVGTIGGLTAVSRVFGFARDMLLARVLGAGGVGDAWQLAFQLPNIFRRLFAEGAFASAFVPLFNRRMSPDEDMTEARRFAEEVMAVLIPVLIAFSALALIAMPWIAGLFANEGIEADPELFDLAVLMARVAFPYLAFMSLATVFAAILNSLSRFAAAAAAPILLNLCMIVALIWGALQADSPELRQQVGLLLAIAVTISCCIPIVMMERGNITLRLGRLISERFGHTLDAFAALLVCAVLAVAAWQIWIYAGKLSQAKETTFVLQIPTAPFWFFVDALLWAAVLVQAIVALRDVARLFSR